MKILFVENSAELQQSWIEPLRADGWGALRAQSVEDADRMLVLHGDSVDVIVVGEAMVKWAETHEFPFIVLTKTWGEKEILKHQNSNRSAFYYQPMNGRVQDLQQAVQAFRAGPKKSAASENTGTWTATKTIALEDFTNVLTKPEITRTSSGTEGSIKLEAPSIMFGGETNPSVASPPTPPGKDQPQATTAKLELETAAPAKTESASEKTVIRPIEPEVSAVKLEIDLEAPTRVYEAPKEATAQTAAAQKAEPSTVILESTEIELTGSDEVSGQISAMEEEQEMMGGDITLNEEIVMKEAVGGPSTSHQQTQVTMQRSPNQPTQTTQNTQSHTVVRVIEGDEQLKTYLSLREQDVAVLTGQVRSTQDRVQQLEMQLKMERARATELQHIVQKQEQQLKNYDQEKQVESEVLYRQVEDLNQQLQERSNKAHAIEVKLKMTADEVNKVKERVRVDVRRIRVREKELESQLEILKKDSAALLQARDEKILELKRKLDLLEFNMELIQEQYNKERQSSEDLRSRLKDAAKAMRQAGGLLEQ